MIRLALIIIIVALISVYPMSAITLGFGMIAVGLLWTLIGTLGLVGITAISIAFLIGVSV